MQLRSERDADRADTPKRFDLVRSPDRMHELICGSCGRTYFADNDTYEKQLRAMEFDPSDLFICDACEVDTEELAHRR